VNTADCNDRVRPMRADDLGLVRAWRNHPDIRRHMFTRHEISLEEHSRWFERASAQPGRQLLIFERGDEPAGFVNLACIVQPAVWDWGFYVAPGSPRGTGRRLAGVVLRAVFGDMSAHKLCAQVLSSNEWSLRFHDALGFAREGVLREQQHDGSGYRDVVCFGLLHHEYSKQGAMA
jgi:UDP-4-amino-4,6-dideoxy-N-acetyl-beta-L-altrosamine N-acetyltransferase